jgi:hypothetical protein
VGSQCTADLESAEARQHDVQEHDVDPIVARVCQRSVATRDNVILPTLPLHVVGNQGRDVSIVLGQSERGCHVLIIPVDTNNLRGGRAPDTIRRYDERMNNDNQQFADAVQRIRAEYLEMPGLKLTRHQAARLWAIEESLCDAVFATLVHDRFLICTRSAAFVRSD